MPFDWVTPEMPERCPSMDGSLRCVGPEGHGGPHWAPLTGDKAMRWGTRGIGCFDPMCVKPPSHPMPHNDGRGCSWRPLDADDEALLDAP